MWLTYRSHLPNPTRDASLAVLSLTVLTPFHSARGGVRYSLLGAEWRGYGGGEPDTNIAKDGVVVGGRVDVERGQRAGMYTTGRVDFVGKPVGGCVSRVR